jgi:hypothetical protein
MKSYLRRMIPLQTNLRMSLALALTAAGLVLATTPAGAASAKLEQALSAYDTAIAGDSTAALAKLTSAVTLDGTGGAPFDFGATSGDTTMEFILQGDPVATGDSGYLAVGQNTGSNLRYDQWQDQRQMGFTQLGVADYLFDPGVPSPVAPTHVTYVWNATDLSMTLYVDGVVAGTTSGVSDTFAMPIGAGFLGANPTSGEQMVGTIYRVTVYSGLLPEAKIKSHADAFVNARGPLVSITSFTATPAQIPAQGSTVLSWQTQNATALYINGASVTGTSVTLSPAVTTIYTLVASNDVSVASAQVTVQVEPPLGPYDAAIAADIAAGLTPVTTLTNTVNLDGTAGVPFDFGPTWSSTSMEFILEGDPVATGGSGYLAVGENTGSSLRYEQWQNTQEMGFTQSGVADYRFSPAVPSPTIATHVVYVWNAPELSMTIYVNGVGRGTVTGVTDAFAMPTGVGFLGANPTGGEAMVGRIFRVVVYAEALPQATVKRHAEAFTSVLRAPIISSFTANPAEIVGQGSSVLSWNAEYATGLFLNNAPVTGTSLTVSPTVTTTYTLVASNAVSTVSSKLTVYVSPLLDTYDAAIAADAASGLAPVASLTNAVALTGSGGVPFDFGYTFGDVTMEFILEGDPTAGADAYLAVGEVTTSSLRYAQWQNTRQMGFTQIGVYDYMFTPAVPSPTAPTHVTYVWNAAELSMKLYINGTLAGTATGVSDAFVMPSGPGYLGATAGGTEAMTGRIYRLAVYSGQVPEATIQKHASAFTSGARGPSLSIDLQAGQAGITLAGVAGTHYRIEYRDSLSTADTWQLLQDIPSLSGPTIRVVDPTSTTGRTQRFYRGVTVR